jgi:hypothetical protein
MIWISFYRRIGAGSAGDLDGFIDKTGKEIGKKYENAGLFSENAKVVLNKNVDF